MCGGEDRAHEVILSEEGEEEGAGATERSVASGTPQQQSSNASIDSVAHVTKGTWHRNDSIAPPSLLEAEMWNLLPGTTISDQAQAAPNAIKMANLQTSEVRVHGLVSQ